VTGPASAIKYFSRDGSDHAWSTGITRNLSHSKKQILLIIIRETTNTRWSDRNATELTCKAIGNRDGNNNSIIGGGGGGGRPPHFLRGIKRKKKRRMFYNSNLR